MADRTRDVVDMLTFESLMNQAGRSNTGLSRGLVHLFPKTANVRGIAGLAPGVAGAVPRSAVMGGAMNVAKMGGRRIPLLAGGLQALGGDPVGGIGTAGGGIAGAMIGQTLIPIPGVGALVGGVIGSQLGQGIARGTQRLAGGAIGIDPNDPLSGPDWNLGPLALTPYAKTKKRTKRGIEIAKMQLPLYNEIADRQLERDSALQSLADVGSIISNVYSNNPYR